jgi:serine/threonine-protein kinase SRPK3
MPPDNQESTVSPQHTSPPRIDWNLYPEAVYVQPHEPLERYTPGGFHPVTLGDTFHDGRYSIHHKLGYGGYSTVWLARDQQEECVLSLF